jgi:TolB-like protein/DNA-binding winged helix-turn-helix (wHTH) protein
MSRQSPEFVPKSGMTVAAGGHVFSIPTKELRTAGGEIVPLRSQSSDILAVLASRAGEVVSKSALIDAVWPDIAVTDDSLVQCIADIRRALGDDGHRIVQTFPKRGYRLNVDDPMPPESAAASPVPARKRLALVLVALLLLAFGVAVVQPAWRAVPDRSGDMPRIAVLPFDDFSGGDDRGYLSDAIAEGVITELARSKTYAVIARNSSFAYRDGPADVRRIGQDLGVDYVLEGSQQKIGDRLKVTAQLIDARDGSHLWARAYDRGIGDLFVVQEEIIRALASSVGPVIERPLPHSDPDQVSALHYFLAGTAAIRADYSVQSNQFMRQMAMKAIEADPSAQFGYINMAWSYRHDAVFGWADDEYDRDEALRRAAEYADKAIELVPDDANAHHVRARIHAEAGENDAALAHFDRAIALNPSDSNVLVGSTTPLLHVGRTEEAIARIEQAKGIDPLYPDSYDWQMGWALWEKHDCAGALLAMQRMARIPQAAHRMLAGIHACLGDKEKAQEALAEFLRDSPAKTLSEERRTWEGLWTAPGSLDRWIEDMRLAGMPE